MDNQNRGEASTLARSSQLGRVAPPARPWKLGRERESAIPVDVAVQGVALTLRRRFAEPLWFVGELLEARSGRGGHGFAVLRNASARIDVHLRPGFAGELPAPGTVVVVCGYLRIREASGGFRIEAETSLLPTDEAGERARTREKWRRELTDEGVFARPKRHLPDFPAAIALVTSEHGAAARDVAAVVKRRAPWVALRAFDCAVQGIAAPASIVRAVSAAGASDADLILLTRGGGGADDLSAFDDPAVVRAIASSRLPVVVAVGHEPDSTLSDLAADLTAPTPSAAAEQVVPERSALLERLRAVRRRVRSACRDTLERSRAGLGDVGARVDRAFSRNLRVSRERLSSAEALATRLLVLVEQRRARVRRTSVASRDAAFSSVSDRRKRLGTFGPDALLRRVKRLVREQRAELGKWRRLLHANSPHTILAKGYAIPVRDDGGAVRGIADVRPGANLRLLLVDGTVDVIVSAQAHELDGGLTDAYDLR